MAPTMLAIASQKENHICPCCQRLILIPQSIENISCSIASGNIHQKFRNDMNSSISLSSDVTDSLTALEDIQISPASCKKLLSFLNSREQLEFRNFRIAATENSASVVSSYQDLPVFSSHLPFLSRKRNCPTGNNYVMPSIALKQHKDAAYQNEVTAKVVQLAKIFQTVEACLWYWGDITNKESTKILESQPVGTFLLRNSSDSR